MSYTDEMRKILAEEEMAQQKAYFEHAASLQHTAINPKDQVSETLKERGSRYGDFTDHAKISQDIQNAMRMASGWDRLDDGKKQALTVIADKIARILNGDPEYRDNWHDIQGYAKLAEDRCSEL